MLYLFQNGAMPTTAAPVAVGTGAAIKTLLQIKPGTGAMIEIVEWGISFDGSAAATPGKVELIETDVAATVTAAVTADITKYNDPNGPAADTALVSLGTAATGYTASVEGSTTAVRIFDLQFLPPTAPYVKQFPLGARPVVNISKFLRVRVTFGAGINAYCYVLFKPTE